ncbi:MAG: thiol-disulfide isomerase/thioredoxin [Halioglobus sp.]|jgi:thiol-disulfide isomerase/thioredoxin
MSRLLLRTLLVTLFTLLVACSSNTDSSSDIEKLRGQWVVINYWAKWCKPCIKEIPELNELNQHYSEVTVVGVNYDGATGESLAAQIEQLGIEFAILSQDPAGELQQPRPVVLPTSIILDPTGKVSQILLGPQTLASLAKATQQSI